MKTKLLFLVIALQSAWVLGTVYTQEGALRACQVILLETERIDPRDLLRGDYVILNYKISNIPTKLFTPAVGKNLPAGETVYVALAQHGQFHDAVRASTSPLAAENGEIIVRGHATSPGWSPPGMEHVEYGLERYYVREGKGNAQGKLTVEAAAPTSGRAAIKEVFLDGEPYGQAVKDFAR
jgi:uncharacterized membrane-anchored protein